MSLKNSTLLITGGTGSFGSTVLKRFLKQDICKEIRVFSRDEKKQDDLRRVFNSDRVKFYIGDIREYDSVFEVTKGVDYVFHAAALKQVPSCEFFPLEATKTNVFGTSNLIKACEINGVKKVICLSTDKAAYPINAMGISKALMEKTAIAESRNNKNTIVCITRYGNVMCSRGSVIPLFLDLIKNKKAITITDPRMTRFLMSLDDAVELVLFAFKHGEQGDMFVHKAPASTIEILSEAILELTEADNREIKFIGTRHGEKLYETLCTKEEMLRSKDLGKFYKISSDNRDLNYNQYFDKGIVEIEKISEYNSHNTKRLSKNEVINLLKTLKEFKEFN